MILSDANKSTIIFSKYILLIKKMVNNTLHFADLGEVGEGGFFGADSHDLWRPHNKAFLLAGDHVWILLSHYVKHSLQQLTNTMSILHKKQSLNKSFLTILLLYYTHLTASFPETWVSRYQKGITSLDLNKVRDNGVLGWQWHQLDHMQTVCTSLQTDNHTNTSSLNFYMPHALPDTQPTVSKH